MTRDWLYWVLAFLVFGIAYVDLEAEMMFTETTRMGLYEAAAAKVPR